MEHNCYSVFPVANYGCGQIFGLYGKYGALLYPIVFRLVRRGKLFKICDDFGGEHKNDAEHHQEEEKTSTETMRRLVRVFEFKGPEVHLFALHLKF